MSRDRKSKTKNAVVLSQFERAASRAGIEAQKGKHAIKSEYRAAILEAGQVAVVIASPPPTGR